jgi:hypothetical protein
MMAVDCMVVGVRLFFNWASFLHVSFRVVFRAKPFNGEGLGVVLVMFFGLWISTDGAWLFWQALAGDMRPIFLRILREVFSHRLLFLGRGGNACASLLSVSALLDSVPLSFFFLPLGI